MDAVRFLWKNLGVFRTRFVVVFLLTILTGVATFFIPVSLARFSRGTQSIDLAVQTLIFLCALYLTSTATSYFMRRYGEVLGYLFEKEVKVILFNKFAKLDFAVLNKEHSGHTLSLIGSIGMKYRELIQRCFWAFGPSLATLFLFFIILSRSSPVLALVNFVILTIFILLSMKMGNTMASFWTKSIKSNAEFGRQLADFMTNVRTVKRLGLYKYSEKALRASAQVSNNAQNLGHVYHARRNAILHGLYGLFTVGTLGYLTVLISMRLADVGTLIIFTTTIGMIRLQMDQFSQMLENVQLTSDHLKQLDFLFSGQGLNRKITTSSKWKNFSLSGLEFQHDEQQQRIRIPNFKLRRGTVVGITGVSGQGKSTFLNLISGSLKCKSGNFALDNSEFPIERISDLGEFFTYLSQEVELFNLSLRENITLGAKMSDSSLKKLFESVELLDWVKGLDKGMNTIVGEHGLKLSSGQKQRVNLIRGMSLKREVYLLDEPTSHLDDKTEKLVVDWLGEILKSRTAIIVTHRPRILELCDRRYEFKDHILAEI